ncbi:hypothetical protein [Nitrososphaera viennensis]|uniref:Uncharacterized protein n=1 Tax=Nitrososphaera viennensis TaxID=1034015 RepID=A0A977NLJ6_9ARCH|nr:hypothetical protein [Nitrososphaera viennensis]UVS67940.1 hypothetical protein NWT39_08490 [Nitrososphaera viennensis]
MSGGAGGGGQQQDLNGAAGNIIQILANLPEFLRKPMLQKRLSEFFDMAEKERQETIALALAAAPTIEPQKLSVLVKTWLEVLAGFDAEKRTAIFSIYCSQIIKQPESLQRLNFQSLTDTFQSLGDREREILADSFKEVLFAFPRREKILAAIPDYSRKALGL